RFSAILPFGVGGICHFLPNVAEMSQRVTRHFEDMLQCLIPAFKGLFPVKHNALIKTLLFHLSEWHALAKLQMHSDDSLAQLDQAQKKLGAEIQQFQRKTCDKFKTYELPNKAAAWYSQQQTQTGPNGPAKSTSTAHLISFNKFHALGDYSRSIQMFGTTDSYTTQTVSG
ncbi:hypothetical protein SCLCIDRAFT_110388, partial [Scleroderma citrinum Foug A]